MTRQRDMYVVRDRGRELTFYGELLSFASSQTEWKPRWFEVAIYRTEGGKYVLAGAGRTRVVHRQDCAQVLGRSTAPCLPAPEAAQCEMCSPPLDGLVVPELDREWAQVSDEPEPVIERLRLRDADGVWYLPRTSANALRAAAELDADLAVALLAPQHVA